MSAGRHAFGRVVQAALVAGLVLAWGCAGAPPAEESAPAPLPDAPARAPETSAAPRPETPPDRPSAPGDVPPAALDPGEWVVTRLAGEPLLEGSRITLEFRDGQVSGTASCNRYVAEWERPTADRVRIASPRSTLRACAPTVMDQERHFLDLLSRFETVRIGTGDDLELRTADGEILRATRSR